MKEVRDIVRAYDLAHREGKRCALATVVHVEGSSYRRPGARMLVTEDGELTGAISGGCLEGDALRKALFAINQQQNKLVTYDTTNEDDVQLGVQLGCNGIVHILFEPVDDGKEYHPVRLLKELIGERRDTVLLTLFSLDRSAEQPGTCLLYAKGGVTTALPGDWQDLVMADIKEAAGSRTSGCKEYARDSKKYNGFVEFIPPPPAVVIAGAGNDVLPLVDMMAMLGWQTTVVDGRPHYATSRRFGKADKVLIARPNEVLNQVNTDAQTLFLLMTHNYNYDLTLLRELVMKGFSYIGILGPRKKLDRMLEELRTGGMTLDDEQLAAIHSPVGLDIGAETAEEIAVSIVAEIKLVLSGGTGGSLKQKGAPIHSRPAVFSSHE
ncbi:MAG TPA: XdhC/CoxI family protein [Puia sp.]|nr:XdhC/CoxI family protein [Puia sp.]